MKGKTMNTQTDNKNNNNCTKKVKLTKHFIERYYERILNKHLHQKFHYGKVQRKVYRDMDSRLMDREKNFIELFSSPDRSIKVPFEGHNQIVIQNRKLVTVLN
jgi:hypothetical protein